MAKPALLTITHDGPIRLRERGAGDDALVWTVQPENFDYIVEMINTSGGPDLWDITPL